MQWTIRKRRGSHRNLVDICPIEFISPIWSSFISWDILKIKKSVHKFESRDPGFLIGSTKTTCHVALFDSCHSRVQRKYKDYLSLRFPLVADSVNSRSQMWPSSSFMSLYVFLCKLHLERIVPKYFKAYSPVFLSFFYFSYFWCLGVQFFGDLHNHCVRTCVENANDVTINDLTIPDTYCKQETDDSYGYDCPR
jgi:hypothetical protein